ncbi:putative PEP-CTERM protein-sorting domain-containing protein [Azospirillaceae bacterium]
MRQVGILIGLLLTAATTHSAVAGPTSVIQDTYWGGLDTYYGYSASSANGDSVGGNPFLVNSAVASRSNNVIKVTINTPYAGNSGVDGTTYGDLLLSPTWRATNVTVSQLLGNWQYGQSGLVQTGTQLNKNGTVSTASKVWNTATINDGSIRNFSNGTYWSNIAAATNTTNKLGDIWQPGDWNYAVTNGANGWGLYRIYDSQIVLANAPGCSNTYPIEASCGWFFRAGEAVAVKSTTVSEFISSASMTIDSKNQMITYTIDDNHNILGYNFAMSWAMTCANDIIQGEFSVPVSGSLGFLVIGLFGVSLARKRQIAEQSV